jgi:serine/threonine protein kinase
MTPESAAETFEGTERFVVRRRLGAGSFGTVYEAFDRERGESVALKVLRETDPMAIYRFKKEFRALTGLLHTNLVELYELMNEGDRWFFTMELVDGVPFLSHVRVPTSPTVLAGRADGVKGEPKAVETVEMEAPGPPDRSTRCDWSRLRSSLLQLAEGLSTLHRAGRVHRDVKPKNVLVTPTGRVVILDFGLVAELAPARLDQSSGLHAVGTPAYMSPEQARGLPAREASDWYGVGVILYEALAGVLPFRGEPADILEQKLRSEPDPPRTLSPNVPEDLDHLCCQLLRRNEERRPSGEEILRQLRSGAGATSLPVERTEFSSRPAPFIGRQGQLEALREAFNRTKEGRLVTLVVRGPSGTGKSALVRRFLTELAKSEPTCVVLEGRCYERESMPYKALDSLIDTLTQFLRALPSHEAEALLPGDVLTLARLFPVLRRVEAVSRARRRGRETPDSQELRRRAVAALRELLARLTDRVPLVLFIDDLQWGDADSAAVLSEVLQPPDPPPLLLILCLRSETFGDPAPGPFLAPRASRALDDPLWKPEEIFLDPLSPGEAEELAARLLGGGRDAAEAARVLAVESRGNLFFLDELIHASLGEPDSGHRAKPLTLNELIETRVSRLPEDARRLLEIVAVAGEPVERSVALRAADVETQAAATLSALQANRLVRSNRMKGWDALETSHDYIRETVVRGLSPRSARLCHRRLAHALEAWGQADPEALAIHFHAADEPATAAEYVNGAARQAAEALAFDRAARLFGVALKLGAGEAEMRALRVSLGEALSNAGRGAEAADAYAAAAQGASAAESLELRRRAAEQLLRSGHVDRGVGMIRDVLGAVGMTLAAGPKRALLSLLLRRAWTRIRGIGFHERDSSQISAERLMRIDVCWTVAYGLGIIDVVRGHDYQTRHLLLALRAGEPYRVAKALALEVAYSASSGGRTRRRTERLRAETALLVARVGHPHALGLATFTSGFAEYLEGRWRTAQKLLEQAEGILRERCTGVSWEVDNAQYYTLRSLCFMGRFDELSRRLPSHLDDAKMRGDLYAETNLRTRVSYNLLLARDEPTRARGEIREMLARWSHRSYHLQHYYDLHGQAEIDLYEGNPKAAWERVSSGWKALERSLSLRAQIVYLESAYLRARTVLAAIAAREIDVRLIELAERDARRIEREDMPWSNPFAQVVRASAAALRGDGPNAILLLASAEGGFEAADEGLWAAAARRRRGELVGGLEGNRLIAEADAAMSKERVVDPVRLSAVLTPPCTVDRRP